MPEGPSFVLLSQKLPAETLAPKLIGRIVESVRQPTNGYRPEDPRSLLGHTPIEVTDTNASVYRTSIRDSTVRTQLGEVLGFSAQDMETGGARLEGKKIITRFLPQHRDAWDGIYAAHKGDIDSLLKLCGGTAYMIVGFKTVVDGTIKVERGQSHGLEGHAELPLGAAVTSATYGAVNLGSWANPGVGAGKVVSADWVARNEIEGEQIFAIQYRVVRLQREGKLWSNKKTGQLMAIHVADFQDGIYGDDDDEDSVSKEAIYEDDDEEESDEEEQSPLEGWSSALSESLQDYDLAKLDLTFV